MRKVSYFIYSPVSPKTECGCPRGGGIKNGHIRYGGTQKKKKKKKKKPCNRV